VTARDAVGQTASTSITVTIRNNTSSSPPPPPPTTPPPSGGLTVALTQPANNSIIAGTNWPAVWVNGAAAGAKVFTLSVDGQTVATANTQSSGPVMMPWNTQTLANGTRTLTVTARDAAGQTASTSIAVTIRNNTTSSPPPPPASAGPLKVAITQPAAPGSIVHGGVSVVLWVEGASGNTNTFTLTLDGVTIGMETTGSRGPVTIPWTTTLITNGTHTLTATVRDATGKTGSTNLSVVVKN
jgi:hypothetical protein